jgi:hypothetical protein
MIHSPTERENKETKLMIHSPTERENKETKLMIHSPPPLAGEG